MMHDPMNVKFAQISVNKSCETRKMQKQEAIHSSSTCSELFGTQVEPHSQVTYLFLVLLSSRVEKEEKKRILLFAQL